MGGGVTPASGSKTGDAGCTYLPVVPVFRFEGRVLGPPKTPKSVPVPAGLQVLCDRSMDQLPPAENAVALFEFTSTLRPGPPQILIDGFPFIDMAPASVGCVTT